MTTPAPELEPCPSCGGNCEVNCDTSDGDYPAESHAECRICGYRGSVAISEVDAVDLHTALAKKCAGTEAVRKRVVEDLDELCYWVAHKAVDAFKADQDVLHAALTEVELKIEELITKYTEADGQ